MNTQKLPMVFPQAQGFDAISVKSEEVPLYIAAPELLKALKKYHVFLTNNFNREELQSNGESWIDAAQRAIDKAEGKIHD